MARDASADVRSGLVGHVGLVEIDRPPANFFDVELVDTLLERLRELDADPRCRAVVLGATGKVFCAGADFGAGVDPDEAADLASALYERAAGIFEIDVPVVAAVQGPAIGGGLGLALAADFRVTSEAGRFSANFARLGMHCGFGISATLPRLVGPNAAASMLLTGRRLTGAEAADIGLADRLVAPGEERAAAQALAAEIAACAPLAVRDMRRSLRAGLAEEVRAALTRELSLQREHMKTADFREGVRAASERRAPAFAGR